MSASWEMALDDIAAAGQQIERNDVMSAGVGQSDGRRDLAAALGHLFAGGDIRRKSWGQHSYVTTVFKPPITDCVGGDPLLALVRANGDHLPGWVFSQQDIFALDWELLPRQEPAQTAQTI